MRSSLLGRDSECALLDGLVAAIRQGESRPLVLRGEAGVGKTAPLRYLIESASDVTIVRAAGVESEMELAYAGLHQLCAPMLDRLETLPAPQRQAMEIAFGLGAGPAADRFLVGLAVLSLFSEAAQERPLLCVVDDAHGACFETLMRDQQLGPRPWAPDQHPRRTRRPLRRQAHGEPPRASVRSLETP